MDCNQRGRIGQELIRFSLLFANGKFLTPQFGHCVRKSAYYSTDTTVINLPNLVHNNMNRIMVVVYLAGLHALHLRTIGKKKMRR